MSSAMSKVTLKETRLEVVAWKLPSKLFIDYFGYSTSCLHSWPKGQWTSHSVLKTSKEFYSRALLSRFGGLPDVRGKDHGVDSSTLRAAPPSALKPSLRTWSSHGS